MAKQIGHADVARGMLYAQHVVAGKIDACKWVKAACARQLDDLHAWQNDPEFPYSWRPDLADHAIQFIQRLRHVSGRWAGQCIRLEPWQLFIVACIFGWLRKRDGKRRYRTVYLEVPRKNAKSTLLAAIGLYCLTSDGEPGPEVYSAATTRDQARVVFGVAQRMAKHDSMLRRKFGIEVLDRALLARTKAIIDGGKIIDTDGKFVPLSSDGHTLDGLNVSCALIDELHAHKTRDVYDVLDTATGARSQPLILSITTAGTNRAGICYELRTYLTQILNVTLTKHGGMGYPVKGLAVPDDAVFGIIYSLDEHDLADDSYLVDDRLWRKANPNYGVSVDEDDMRRLAMKARVSPSARLAFQTKRLNIWVNAAASWMDMTRWDDCADPKIKPEDFAGQPCVMAIDAAFRRDLFARITLFERDGIYYVFGRYYLPEAVVVAEEGEHWYSWTKQGHIKATEGEIVDFDLVRQEIVEEYQKYKMREIAYDPAQMQQLAAQLYNHDRLPMVEVRPHVSVFDPAMKALEERILTRRLIHTGDPVLTWSIANTDVKRDDGARIYPIRRHDAKKIDPTIALIMAIARMDAMQTKTAVRPRIITL